MKATAAQLYMPPAGYNFLAVLGTGIGEDYHFLAVGNKKVPGSECRGSGGYDMITFTPDGKHWAARCQTQSGSHFVIADGKKGQEYKMTSDLVFTADGTVAYFAIEGYVGKQSFVVLGEDESEGSEALSPAVADSARVGVPGPTVIGAHLAYVSRSTNPPGSVMHIDGKSFPAAGSAGKITFSPDGKHFAFVTTGNDPRYGTVVLDGVPQQATYMDMSQMTLANHPYYPPIQFSPDSNHVAWYGTSPSDNGSGIFLDGKFFHSGEAGISPMHLSFSPDSKHLVYGNVFRSSPDTFGVFVDGRLAAQVDLTTSLNQNQSSWQWAPDGSLIVFGQDVDGLKRLRIHMPDDTSLATIAGAETTLAQKR
jgi:Tol biopolymer transport system component